MKDSMYKKVWCVYKASKPMKYWNNDNQSELIEEDLEYWEAQNLERELNEQYAPLTSQGYRDIIYKICKTNEWHEANDIKQIEIVMETERSSL